MQWHPFLLQYFPRERELGAVFAGSVFMQFVGVWLAPHLLRHIKDERKTLAVVQLLLGLGIALTTLWSNPVMILFFFGLYQFARGMYMPIKDDYLVRSSPKEERTTYISFEAQSHHLGGMAGLLVAGLLGQYLSITGAWVLMGFVVVESDCHVRSRGVGDSRFRCDLHHGLGERLRRIRLPDE
jgi:MFS family permease